MAFIPFVVLFLVGLRLLAQGILPADGSPVGLFETFLPPHAVAGGRDPLAGAERLLTRIATQGGRISIVALPLFLWFSTRLFAGIRGSLNLIYGERARRPTGGFVLGYLKGKLRDLGMVITTIALLTANTVLSGGLALLQARGAEAMPALTFFLTSAGRVLGEALAFGFLVTLFVILYRYASFRRLEWGGALTASVFAGVGFEIAKRLFGFYLTRVSAVGRMSLDADLGAVLLAMLWMWYTAFVFLLGAVVADTWEHPDRPHRKAPILT